MGWRAFGAITVGLCAAVFLAVFWTGGPGPSQAALLSVVAATDVESAYFGECAGSGNTNCVVDGDTFWYAGRKIRIADINTPELGGAQCTSERQLGKRAKDRLRSLLNDGAFTLESIDRDQDKYGRDLRIITRSGESLGAILVEEGLAEEWQGYRREWC
jgi:micrococcal nuclease